MALQPMFTPENLFCRWPTCDRYGPRLKDASRESFPSLAAARTQDLSNLAAPAFTAVGSIDVVANDASTMRSV